MTPPPRAKPVSILGVGAVCAAGDGVSALWDAVLRAQPLARPVTRYDAEGLGTRVAALHPRGLDPLTMCLAATREALGDNEIDPDTALLVGTSLGGVARWEGWHRARVKGEAGAPPAVATHDDLAPAVAAALGLRGPALTVSTACTSGAAALVTALDLLRGGEAREALVIGVDTLGTFVHAGFDRLGALSPDALPPAPFAADRAGLWLGEGCAAMRLGAGRGLGVLRGGATAVDGVHMTAPDRTGDGLRRAIVAALRDAGCTPGEVAWVSAHATCTRHNDAMEAAALRAVFGDAMPPVHGAKPVLGHTLGACGVIEATLALLALRQGVRPPTHQRALDPALPAVPLDATAQPMGPGVALSLNAAMGGHNTALVLGVDA